MNVDVTFSGGSDTKSGCVTANARPSLRRIFRFSNGTRRPCTGAMRAGLMFNCLSVSSNCSPYSGERNGSRGSSPAR